MTKQVLVTTGATVTFTKLIQFVLDPRYIGELIELGYADLVVQYGKSTEAKSLIEGLLSKVSKEFDPVEDSGFDEAGQIQMVFRDANDHSLQLRCIRFDRDLVSKYTAPSELVISHAGTGSILDSLRIGKKLIVLINEALSDNHQVEIAKAFQDLNVLKVAQGNFSDFLELTREVEHLQFERLPEPNGSIVEEVLLQEAKV
ncbi:DEKNAAC101704 [Brettanomyces naardenensis]|uniref:UDP-N-acetylglucosamine transferase subunit ALG13 n=1 Tax=Brettanomyces naardenensis TaxID=13370 RepID=A0A448YIL4_BRENA|nr:DEKNAAC101704 [Brettanomyces naardenensis]